MTTKRENILAAIRTALTGTTGVGTRIYRTRVDPVARAESPAIIVQPIRDVCVQTTSLPKLDWTMTVDGTDYTVREPMLLDDGKIMRVMLMKD